MSDDLDAIAARYYDTPPADEWIEDRVVRWIMPKIIGWCSGRTLEMGYGAGRTTEMLHAADVDLTVIEGSNELATAARRVLPGRVAQMLFEVYDPGPVYDTVLCLHVLEHVEDTVGLLSRVHSWLKPGGRLIVVTPNAESIHRQVGSILTGDATYALSERDRLVGHRRVYDADWLLDDVAAAGFVDPVPFGFFLKPVNNARMVDWPPDLIDALCYVGEGEDYTRLANIGVRATAV